MIWPEVTGAGLLWNIFVARIRKSSVLITYSSDIMKRSSAFLLLLAALSTGVSLPAFAQSKNTYSQPKGSLKAEKKQAKAQRKYAKQQKKAQKKMLKTEKKNTHIPPQQF